VGTFVEGDSEVDPLLSTKLFIPQPGPKVIVRPCLMTRLNAGLSRRFTLVSAPAGFGKTTLISAWARQLDAPVGWLSLDASDNTPARFLRYVGAALARAVPAMDVPLVRVDRGAFETVLVPLINQIAERDAPLVLVLDDYHLIKDTEVDEALIFLIDNAPPQLHVVIATRADPAFPLPRWRTRQQILEIRADDLRFTRSETDAFLQTALDLTLDARDLNALNARAEGWVAALQLVALSLREQEDVSSFVDALSGTHRYILDYLIQEVLQRQPPAVQAFLLQTSILDRLSAPLCDAVIEDQDTSSRAVLARLEHENLFLVRLDEERRWYRYHRLFRDFLRARLEIEQPDLRSSLHYRAARWYAGRDATDDAIHHALAAPDHALAAELIAQTYPAMLQRGEVVTLKGWLEALPSRIRRKDPVLMLAYAWTRAVTLDVDDMEDCLEELDQLIDSSPDLSPEDRAGLRGELLTIRASRTFPMGDMEATIRYAEEALAQLPEVHGVVRSVVAHTRANAYQFLGEMEASADAYGQAITEGRHAGNYLIAFSGTVNLGELYRLQGRWRDAEALYRDALAWADAHQAKSLDGLVYAGLGLIDWDRWDLTEARHHLERGVELSRRTGTHTLELLASGALACLAHHQDEQEEARRWLNKTLTLSQRLDYAEAVGFADLLEAQCYIARDDRLALERWMTQRRPLTRLSPDMEALEAQVVAHARLALGEHQDALAALVPLRERVEAAGWIQRLVEILILEALAHDALDEHAQAVDRLERALELGEPGCFVRPFVQAGDPIVPLLRRTVASGRATAQRPFVECILTALDVADVGPSSDSDLVEPLTDRELEVLRLLPTDLATAEVADALFVSYHTVRTHLKHIYNKLDVHSRHEAVTRAQNLNLLDS
jgi:LuxR family transcriptional regulator, maltose regulon positive regulatory protein